MTTEELSRNIDEYLVLFKKSGSVTDKEFRAKSLALHTNNVTMQETQNGMVQFGIAVKGRDMDGDTWTLTPIGHKVVQVGTWRKYVEQQEEREILTIKQIESTINTNESVRKTNKWQIWILAGTFLVAIVSAGISLLNYIGSNQKTPYNSERERADTVSSYVQPPKPLKQDSSKNKADSTIGADPKRK